MPIRSSRASPAWDDKSHRSLTQRSVTRATENKIDTDKHRLMHIHAPTLYKRRYQHRPATDTECTTHTASHAYTCASHAHTRTHADATSPMHKFRIKHIIIFTHTSSYSHTHTHTRSHRQSETHSFTVTHTCTNTGMPSHSHRLAAPFNG
jgi:hypothetical protein